MKKNKINYLRLSFILAGFFALLVLLIIQSSCREDACVPPSIDSLTFRDDTQSINYLVPTRLMTVHGSHFKGETDVYINHAQLNPAYILITDTTITFRTPLVTANSDTTDLSDSILVVKECGNALLMVNIRLAPPVITKISNEYAVAGDIITLFGYYFNDLDTVIFPGEILGTILAGYVDDTCQIIVPEGVTDRGEIVLISKSGSGSSAFGIVFNDSTGLICNFDDIDSWAGWGGRVINSYVDNQIPEANGYFYAGEADNIAPGSAPSPLLILPLRRFTMPDYTGSLTPDYFNLKFELFSKYAWESGYYQIKLGNIDEHGTIEFTYEYNFQPWNDTIYNGSFFNPSWKTMNISMSEFTLSNSNNLPIQSYSQIRAANYMQWLFVNPEEEEGGQGGQYISHLCVAMDNFRIVQVKSEE